MYMLADTTIGHIDAKVSNDRERLFSLADQVVAAAPERRWNLLVTDARSAHFVTRFLCNVLRSCAPEIGKPAAIAIANSRSIGDNPDHIQAVQKLMRRPRLQGRRVLEVTDHVETGASLGRLTQALSRTNPELVDAAVLTTVEDTSWHGWADIAPGELYLGKCQADRPSLWDSRITEATGLVAISGCAEPQPNPYTNQALMDYVGAAFDRLSQEYTQISAARQVAA
jgi:hypoxanthine phosphoribosyltransferase